MKNEKKNYCEQAHCFANDKKNNLCKCLEDTDFGDRACPFFKTQDRYEWELELANRHNRENGIRIMEVQDDC